MSLKLGDLLLKEGLLTPSQLDEALKYQVIFGGRLGTNLIEMGIVDEDAISRALSRKFGVPAVSADELIHIPPAVVQLLPRDIVEKYRLMPLRLDGRRLTVAMSDPSDLRAIDDISFRTGLIIRPQVAAEVRIVLALEQYYGIDRERRYIHAAKKIELRHKKPATDRPMLQGVTTGAIAVPLAASSATAAMPAPPVTPLTRPAPPATPSPIEPEEIEIDLGCAGAETSPAEAEELVELEDADIHEEEFATQAGPAQDELLDDGLLAERLVEAQDRDDILGAVADRLAAEFPRCAVFLARGDVALGWRCQLQRRPLPGFDQFQIPLDEPSVIKTVVEGRSFYLGPIARTPFNSMLLQELGGTVPETALLVPLMMMGRVVAVLYVDGAGINLGDRLFELQKLTARAAMAFEILVLKNKILSL